MLHALSQKPKPLAWILVMVLYAELAAPLILKAEVPRAYKHAKKWEPAVGLFEAVAPQNPEGLNSGNLTMPTIKPSRFDERQVKAQLATGPGQPEMQAFSSVNNTNMVDLFSGDFSKSIPLMDVGGYPINLSYRSGITMDQEASWVGLGFSINPGTINRNMRGIPDDFNGMDSVKKISGMKDNKTIGVTVGADAEIGGTPFNVGAQYGVFHNNYKGWGLEYGLNASINAGIGAGGELTSGLSLTNNSQEGVTLAPSFTIAMKGKESNDKPTTGASFTTSLPFNSRSGMKSLQLGLGMGEYVHAKLNKNRGSSFSSEISFASPSYTPASKNIYTSSQFSFTGKIGGEIGIFHGNLFISGYVSKQKIADEDTLLSLPAYGYLNYQDGAKNKSGMLDFNREKELVYREKPAVPHIALPIYTYDVFSITGEGIGGMFRGYRGDIGFVYDPLMKSKDISGRLSVDFGAGNLVHGGTDLNVNRSYTRDGPWMASNTLKNVINFRKDSGSFEASYFRNPGEKSVNSKQFYDAIGGDDLVSIDLYQPTKSSPTILATNSLTRYKDKKKAGNIVLKPADVIRKERDKRSQVISYLNAKEASIAGLSKYIESYNVNQFQTEECASVVDELYGNLQTGLITQYYEQREFKGRLLFTGVENEVYHNWGSGPEPKTGAGINDYSVRWAGKIKVPVTGAYVFKLITDDGGRLFINDTLVVNNWSDNAKENSDKGGQATANLNLIKDEFYDIKVEYYENKGKSSIELFWSHPGQSLQRIPAANFYQPFKRDTFVTGNMIKEKRLNSFRKSNHISEISVLNNDGRRYVYGIPVYNLKQTEATYAINPDSANKSTALAKYTQSENSVYGNKNGKDNFVSKQEVPAYAHSFLLTGIVSPDYVDLTGNGITDDDLGDGIRFNYSKVYGITNPFKWRAPYAQDSVTYNESLKTDNRDDRASYVYGEKELWFLHSIISKSMIATFVLDLATPRKDLLSITESGKKQSGTTAKSLKEINLYNKADFNKNGVAARPIKTVHFKYSYRLCKGLNSDTAAGKLTLDSVWFTYNGNNKGKQNPYVFYYTGPNPRYNARSYDRWGNFKDALQNPGSVAGNVIQNDEYPYSLQDSLLAAKNAAAWALDSISLPSGGSIKVDYESDDYAFVQNKRAMQLFKLAGLGTDTVMPSGSLNKLYTFGMLTGSTENLYVYITVPTPVTGKADVYYKYLSDIKKLYFKLFVKVPPDEHGSGYEYVSCYADLANSNAFGMVNANTIWLKLKGISLKGDEDGDFSPLAKAAIQFIRLNLPSKAYPGSEVGDNMDLGEAVKMLASMTSEIGRMFSSFDKTARENSWCSELDLNRTFIRLNSPEYKKYGGGHRVKRIKIYDNWNKMTGQRPALYGQEYHYSTTSMVNGSSVKISSGVACYEPGIGGEENPLRVPIEYVEKVAPLAPVTMGYSEEPLGESLYPSPGVGYSKVQVRTINYKKTKSANGLEETRFYTAYDFPTITDRSIIDGDTKKRFSPRLSNFLRINARHFLALSQGFKVELNDMHGKMRSQASYAETDFVNPIKYTENIYKVQNRSVSPARLANEGIVMKPDGTIDTAAIIGKDVELMVDMKEQVSISLGFNISPNVDVFTAGFPPLWAIPSLLNLVQRQENQFRTAAVLKVVNRFGILDSVIQIDKGSKISTKDLMYDSETGDAILTRTQNEFNDPIYNFNYPAHWAYDGMGMAYKNINLKVNDIDIKDGKITRGMPVADSLWFSSGDEILVAGKVQTDASTGCSPQFSTFPYYSKIWAIDTSILKGGKKAIYFIDKDGKPYNGFNISLNIIRSGRRNMLGSVGAVTSLASPLVKNSINGKYEIKFDSLTQIVNSSSAEFSQIWKIYDVKRTFYKTFCDTTYYYSDSMSYVFTRNNCDSGKAPGTIRFYVDAAHDSSYISKEDANLKAMYHMTIEGQNWANLFGACYTGNDSMSQTFTRNNCDSGKVGGTYTYVVPAGTDTSYLGKAAANQKALDRIALNGQSFANLYGSCYYVNDSMSQTFTRNNCDTTQIAGTYVYTVSSGTDTSYLSKAAANAKALARITLNGQAYANLYASCYYGNDPMSQTFTRNNCDSTQIPGTYTYYVAAGTDTSYLNKATANAKALARITLNGQTYANLYGSCQQIYYNVLQKDTFYRSTCPAGSVAGMYIYSRNAGLDTSHVSQAAANAKARYYVDLLGQGAANLNGPCVCTTEGYKFIGSNCEFGTIEYICSGAQPEPNKYWCLYRYRWSDNSISDEYWKITTGRCTTVICTN